MTKKDGFESVAKSLREFGYPDASAEMVEATWNAMERGDDEMPHGVVGMFAKSQLDEVRERFRELPDA